jgi:hypothetical protein
MDLPLPADRWDIHRLTGDGRTHESFGIRHRGASDGRGAAPHRCMPPVDLSAALTLQPSRYCRAGSSIKPKSQ